MKIRKKETINRFWQNLVSGSINRQMFSAALVVATCTLLVKLVAFSKESIVAWKFGTNNFVDAFLISAIVPDFIAIVIAGSLHAALIPTYIQIREQEGAKEAEKLLSGVILWSLTLLGITTLFMIATAPLYLPWMTIGFSDEKLALTFKLFYITTPLVLLTGITWLLRAVLNAEEGFVLTSLSPITQPAVTIMLLLLWGRLLGIFALNIGLIVGAVLEIILLGVVLYRRGIILQPKWFGLSLALRQVAKQYLPAMMGSLLMCSTTLVDQSMAAMLSPGSVAALTYGSRVSSIPLMLGGTAIGTVVTPYLSKMVALTDWQGVNHSLRSYLKLIFFITVPFTGLLVLLSEPIVQLLFQRGAFTDQETHLVAQILSAYALQIPFYIASIFVVKLLTSLCLNHILMWVSVFNLIINISLNYLFMQWLGIQGIALSTSCVYLFSFFYVLFFALKNLRKFSTV
jgi:putative peptidoglycan lipid II flippase